MSRYFFAGLSSLAVCITVGGEGGGDNALKGTFCTCTSMKEQAYSQIIYSDYPFHLPVDLSLG